MLIIANFVNSSIANQVNDLVQIFGISITLGMGIPQFLTPNHWNGLVFGEYVDPQAFDVGS